VFVRVLTVSDVIDLYRVRKLVECAAVRDIDSPPHSVQEQLVDTYTRQTPDG
jgi:DNA-binding GntR family transcriptional regulator